MIRRLVIPLLVAVAVGCGEAPEASVKTGPKADCDALLAEVLPFAEEMIEKHREFYPFGATMSAEGEIAQAGGWTGTERPEPTEIMGLLERGFRERAATGEVRATAIVVDIRAVPPGKTEKQDAIAVALDHRDDHSVIVIHPYSFDTAGKLVVEEPFTQKGGNRIFPR